MEEVFEHLKCTRDGLTSAAAQERIDAFGYNKLEEKQVPSCSANMTSHPSSLSYPFLFYPSFVHLY